MTTFKERAARVVYSTFPCDMAIAVMQTTLMLVINVKLQNFSNRVIGKAFSKLYRQHHELVSKFNVGLNTPLHRSLSAPHFYNNLIYKFKRIIERTDFSDEFRKIIIRYKCIGFNLNAMRQSACLVIDPIMVDNFSAILNCTPVDWAPDSMIVPT